MAFSLKNIGNALKDTKSRTILIVIIVIILVAILIAYFGLKRSESKGVPSEVSLQKAPGVTSLPGVGSPSREYTRLQEQENVKKAQEALKQGTSAIPTLTRTTYTEASPFAQPGTISAVGGGSPDCTPQALARARAAGVKIEELRCKGCNPEALRAAGYTAGEMLNAGFSASDLKKAGFGADQLREAGLSSAELAQAGFTPGELAAAGFDSAELQSAGLTAQQIAAAGLAASTGKATDCSPEALQAARKQGTSASNLRKLGCGAAALRAAGYTAEELKNAGFTAGELRTAGFSAKDLKNAGFGADELRAAGFGADELAAAGYSADELAAAGFSQGELMRAGIAVSNSVAAAPTVKPGTTTPTVTQPNATVPTATATLPSIAGSQDSGIAALERLQQRQAEQLSLQERQDRITQLQQTMSQQAGDLVASWSPPPTQQYQAGEPLKEISSQGAVGASGLSLQQQALSAMLPPIKAGCIMFGVLDTSLNSDEPSPILATVVDGRCENDSSTNAFVRCPNNIDGICNNGGYFNIKGAKLIGNFQRVDKKVIVSFNLMNVPGIPQSIPIDAVAIDPNTARTALADHVDSHYLLRFGTLFATSFISGFGKAIEESGSTTNISLAGISQTFQTFSAAQQAAIALGNVGQRFGETLASTFNRPPTVEVNSGTGIGLLFRMDVAASTQGTATAAPNPSVQTVQQPPPQPITIPATTSNHGTAAIAPGTAAVTPTLGAIQQATLPTAVPTQTVVTASP